MLLSLQRGSAINEKTLEYCYVEIKCQLDATDDIYCRFYCILNMFRAILCPSQELESIIQMVAACGIWCFGFQVVGMMWS